MRLIALALAALTAACGGPAVGDIVSQEVSLTVRAVSSDPVAVAIGESDGGVTVTRVFVSASALSLLPCDDAVAPLVLEARGYELVSESPFGERVTTAVSEFCGVRLSVDPLTRNEAEAVPEGASLHLEGTDASGDPFTLSSSGSFSLLLETDEQTAFGEVPLLLGFDVAVWLAGLPLPEDMTDMAAQTFEDQLDAAVALYVDEDEDGALDDAESTPIARSPAP